MKKTGGERVAETLTVVLILAIGAVGGYNFAETGRVFGFRIPFVDVEPVTKIYRMTYAGQPVDFQEVSFDLFWKVWRLLEEKYYQPDDLDNGPMVDGAIAGMVSALGDPYTLYLPPENNEISEGNLAGSFGGVGIELDYIDQMVGVGAPIAGGPAERAGIRTGDVIMHVRDEAEEVDEDTYDWTLAKIQQVLRGTVGTPVVLTIYREGEEPFEVEIVREVIKVDSLKLNFIEHGERVIAHLQLSSFSERTFTEWNAAVNEILIRKKDLAGVILDLRGNLGGYFNEAIHVASEFIDSGVVVVEKGRTESHEYQATGQGRLTDVPLVVLVNGGSASSSEIVAGAIRDHHRGQLVGTTTFGKGLIQERLKLDNDGALNVTVAQWVLPGGQWLNKDGIEPDIEVEPDYETEADEVLDAAVRLFD